MDTYRALFTADNHFDARSPRWEDCKQVHRHFAGLCRELHVDLAGFGGDMYERWSTPDEREAVAECLTKVAETCPIVVVKGNHDEEGDCALMTRIRSAHPIRVTETWSVDRVGAATIATMAWLRRSNLSTMLAAGGTPLSGEHLTERAHSAARSLLAGIGQRLCETHTDGGPTIFLAHGIVTGAVMSNDQPVRGSEVKLSLDDIALVGADISVFGHIHMAQDWSYAGRPVLYTGSPFHKDFGEPQAKSFTLATWKKVDGVWAFDSFERIPSTARRMIAVAASMKNGAWEKPIDAFDPAGADVRLTFTFDPEEESIARTEAGAIETAWREGGAADVQLKPAKRARSVTRAPEVARAVTLCDKVNAAWPALGVDIDDARKAAVLKLISSIDTPAVRGAAPRPGGVRWKRVKVSGLHPFPNEVTVDWDAIPGEIVAVRGVEGSGKSTLTGALVASLSLAFPRYGHPKALVRPEGGVIETTVEAGDTWTIRVAIPAEGSPECTVTGGSSIPTDLGPKAFKPWVQANLPDVGVLQSTMLWAQKNDGFLGMSPADRKGGILDLAGCTYLAALAGAAMENAKAAKEAATTALGKRDGAAQSSPGTREQLVADRGVVSARLADAEETRDRIAGLVATAEEQVQAFEEARARAQRVDAIKAQIADVSTRLDTALADRDRDDAILAQGGAIEEAVAVRRERVAEVERLRGELSTAREELRALQSRVGGLRQRIEIAEAAATSARQKLEARAEARAAKRVALQATEERARATIALHAETVADGPAIEQRATDARATIGVVARAIGCSEATPIDRMKATARDQRDRAEARVKAAIEHEGKLAEDIRNAPADGVLDAARSVHQALRDRYRAGLAPRVAALRSGLVRVQWASAIDDATAIATSTITDDDAEAGRDITTEGKQAAALLDALEAQQKRADAAQADLPRAQDETARAREALVTAEQTYALVDHLDASSMATAAAQERALATARSATEEARRSLARAEEDLQALDHEESEDAFERDHIDDGNAASQADRDTLQALVDSLPGAEANVVSVESRVSAADLARDALADLADRHVDLEAARARRTSIDERIAHLRADHARLSEDLASAPVPPPIDGSSEEARTTLRMAQDRARTTETAIRDARVELGVLDAREKAIDAHEARMVALDADVAAANDLVINWNHAAKVLGKNGLQALEVDAVGPAIASAATTLLHDCYSPRWSVSRFEIAPPKDKGTKDGLDVMVVDNNTGIERKAETLSPGQQTFIGTAITLAMAEIAAKQGGSKNPTVVLDEVGGSLSTDGSESWVAMVRQASKRINASKVIIVTHSPRVEDLADAVLTVDSGSVSILA